MVNYKLGKIYCLRSHQTDKIYIGSSAQPLLSTRLGGHKAKYKMWLNGKGAYISSFELLEYEDVYIELLESYTCDDKHQLHRKEGEYIRKMGCVNKNIPGRTDYEYYQDNKEKVKQYYQDNKEIIKQYRQNNKEIISEKGKQYYQNNKEIVSDKNKQYYQDKKEILSEQRKQYYQNNKEILLERITCKCGSIVTKINLTTHKKSKKHIKFYEFKINL